MTLRDELPLAPALPFIIAEPSPIFAGIDYQISFGWKTLPFHVVPALLILPDRVVFWGVLGGFRWLVGGGFFWFFFFLCWGGGGGWCWVVGLVLVLGGWGVFWVPLVWVGFFFWGWVGGLGLCFLGFFFCGLVFGGGVLFFFGGLGVFGFFFWCFGVSVGVFVVLFGFFFFFFGGSGQTAFPVSALAFHFFSVGLCAASCSQRQLRFLNRFFLESFLLPVAAFPHTLCS